MNGLKQTKKLTECALLCALAIVILFMASAIGVGIYAGPVLASAVFLILSAKYGAKTALIASLATALLSLILLPDRELALFQVCFGWYPAILPYLNYKIQQRPVRIGVKLVIFTGIVFVMYGIIFSVMGLDAGFFESKILNGILYITGCGSFLLLDFFYARLFFIYKKYIKG